MLTYQFPTQIGSHKLPDTLQRAQEFVLKNNLKDYVHRKEKKRQTKYETPNIYTQEKS